MLNKRTQNLLNEIVRYLTAKINKQIEDYNREKGSDVLPMIAESDVGYRDIATGLRFYPALLVMETDRDATTPYFTDYTLSFCLAHRNEDMAELQEEGSALADCLEDALRSDNTLGGIVMDSSDVRIETAVVSSMYVAACGITVTVDLGSYDGMGGED